MERPERSAPPPPPADLAAETWAIVGGRGRLGSGSPLNVPPILASNFVAGADRLYSREHATETWEAFEQLLGGWEGGTAVSFASGMGAVASVFDLLPVGATVVLPQDCYQRVGHLADEGERAGRWSVTRLPGDDTVAWMDACGRADLIWLESPSNPTLVVQDLPAICSAARTDGSLLVVDNTVATPLAQRPLELGADVVVHSATKFIGGHSDLLLGAAVVADGSLAERLRDRRALSGAVPGALEAYLALRGARTLPLRLRQATASAEELAERLDGHDEVTVVRYPGLPGHPTHETARRTLDGFGALMSFDVRGDAARADALCRRLRVIHHATSLGGVESTIERRASHAGQEHLSPTLLRLSVGCEGVADLWGDVCQALAGTT